MAKFNNVEHETFQSWHIYMIDLMSQKKAWHQMVSEIPVRNMAQSYQHKIIEICENFAKGVKLAVEFMASETQNNICFYLVDKDGDDSGTRFLCGNRMCSDKFCYTHDKYASDVAGCILSYLRNNGFLTY
jgi:hypothetical protein